MKNISIDGGWIVEGFSILPSFTLNWMTYKDKRYYDLQIAFMFWYVTIGQIKTILKKCGY